MRPYHIIVSCEHGGNTVPHAYHHLFIDAEDILQTHRGYDTGALSVAKELSDELRAKLFFNEISRLIIDTNRSLNTADLFSEYTSHLKAPAKEHIIEHYYTPYRERLERYILNHLGRKPLLHLSVHTFTPIMNGVERGVDIGLLFDENNPIEREFCNHWRQLLVEVLPQKNVMLNVPYNGSDDGFTTHMRQKATGEYLGIEIEINQKYAGTNEMKTFVNALIKTIDRAIDLTNKSYLLNLP